MKMKKQLEDEVLFTTVEVAIILDISRTMVCRHIKRKGIPVKIDKTDSMQQYLLSHDTVVDLITQLSKSKQKNRLESLENYLANSKLIYRSMIDENFIE